MKAIILAILTFLGLATTKTKPAEMVTITPEPTIVGLQAPIAEFRTRITKKGFGLYVSPKNSPVSPERFTGYHTGVDVEYGDVLTEVSVYSVYDGTIVYSGWVSGYGGLVAERINYRGNGYVIIYGHLAPTSLIKKGGKVERGQKIGVLGRAYSTETDGERRHLHLAIVKGEVVNFKGYVAKETELSGWVNPLELIQE